MDSNRQNESKDLAKDEQWGIETTEVTLAELLDDIIPSDEKRKPRARFKLTKDFVILQPNINHHTVNRNNKVYENLKQTYTGQDAAKLKKLVSDTTFYCKDFVISKESEENGENINPVVLTGRSIYSFLE